MVITRSHRTCGRLSCAFVLLFFMASVLAASSDGLFQTAPRFTGRDIDNRIVSLDTLLSRGPVIVDFWATWCVPCMAEFRAVEKLLKKYGDKNITVLAVSEDGPSEEARVRQTVKTKRLPFIVVLDKDRSIAKTFNVNAMPTLFLIGSDGIIRMKTQGFIPGDETKLEKEIKSLPSCKK